MTKAKATRGKRSKAGQAKDLPVKAFTSVSNVLR